MPGSTNTWTKVYQLPDLTPKMQQEMIENEFDTVSDSFYFHDGKLIVHNKAAYSYHPDNFPQME
jgi:hypothetical protein